MNAVFVVILSLFSQVTLRGGTVLNERVTGVSIEGVQLDGDDSRQIGWDRVHHVSGKFAQQAETFASISDAAWRARTRLARGDISMAEPLFDELFTMYVDVGGQTSLVVAEGLLRCRVRKGALIESVPVWLKALSLREAGESLAGEPPLPPAIDEETGLVPALPPIWLSQIDAPSLTEESITSIRRVGSETGDAVHQLQALYALASMKDGQRRADVLEDVRTDYAHLGVSFVADIVLTQIGNSEQRAPARERLEAQMREHRDSWKEAWARVAIGRSYIRDGGRDSMVQGVVHLLHVPSRFSEHHPYLTGVALAEVVLVLDALNENEADVFLDTLVRFDPRHPALQWVNEQRSDRTPDETGAP